MPFSIKAHPLNVRSVMFFVVAAQIACVAADAKAPSVLLVSSSDSISLGEGVKLTATVTPLFATGTVTFYDGSVPLGTRDLSTGQAALITTLLPSGVRVLRAIYRDGNGSPAGSTSVLVTVRTKKQTGFDLLPKVNAGTTPTFSAIGDFDGDGRSDLAITNQQGNTVTVLLGKGNGYFQPGVAYSTGKNPTSIAIGDFNSDGTTDLAIINAGDMTVSILLGRTDGTFLPAMSLEAGDTPASIAVGDFNGDGVPDLAIADTGSYRISLLLGKGDGTFTNGNAVTVNGAPHCVVVGDFNGDGYTDLATANFISGTGQAGNIDVFLGNGNGTFHTPSNYLADAEPLDLTSGDINKDGNTDLVIASQSRNYISVLIGRGDGGFKPAVKYSVAKPQSVVLGDFDGNGETDIASIDVQSNSLWILYANSDGSLQVPVSYSINIMAAGSLAIGDFNNDGRTDLVMTDPLMSVVSVLLGKPPTSSNPEVFDSCVDGTHSPSTFKIREARSPITTSTFQASFGSADLQDLNGAVDFAGTNSCQSNLTQDRKPGLASNGLTLPNVSVRSDGMTSLASSLNPSTLGQTVIVVASLTPVAATGVITFYDGISILGTSRVVGGTASLSTNQLGSGTHPLKAIYGGDTSYLPETSTILLQMVKPVASGGLSAGVNYSVGANPISAAIGDFDGDGRSDIAVGSANGVVSILLGKGDGSFNPAPNYTVGSDFTSLVSGDFNLDGHLDLIAYDHGLYWLRGNGDGTFQSPLLVGDAESIPVVGDFNGDGIPDLALGGSAITILLGIGNGTFTNTATYSIGDSAFNLAIADFDGDGNTDLVATNPNTGTVTVLMGMGDGTFSAPGSFLVGPSPSTLVVGDFNGDGKLDLAVTIIQDLPFVIVLAGNGDGTFGNAVPYQLAGYPWSLVAGDFNGDGWMDFAAGADIFGGTGGPSVDLYLSSSSGSITFLDLLNVTSRSSSLTTADFNGDGRIDLVSTNYSTNDITVFLGVGPLSSQTITFGPLSDVAFGTAPVPLQATTSSGLPVSFGSSSLSCTVSGLAVTLISAGTCSISANQFGDSRFAAAVTVVQSFNVLPAQQTVIFGPLSGKTFGVSPFTVIATASSGLAVDLESTTLSVCTVAGNVVTIVNTGTCWLTASQTGSGNYVAAASVVASFTVNAAAQTIIFGPLNSVSASAAPFAVSATASSGLAVTFTSTPHAVCTVAGSTVTVVSAGTCSLTASQAGNANFAAAPSVVVSFAVNAAAQTITFGALGSLSAVAAPFALTATASSGLFVSFASTTPTVCTVVWQMATVVAAGVCSINATQAGNANYLAAPVVTQSFVVTSVQQTISFERIGSVAPGAPPFALTASASSGLPVSFSSNTSAVCTVSGSTATILNAGTCSITASQVGSAVYAAALPATQTFTVVAGATSITLSSSANPATFGRVITLTATVTPSSAAGVVAFYDGAALLGAGRVTAGRATFTTTLLPFGGHSLKAYFRGQGFVSSVSAPLAENVITAAGSGFRRAINYGAGSKPQFVVASDFNGDGKADVAVANHDAGTVSVLLGNGDGTFGTAAAYGTGTTPVWLAIADFNGDGYTDLAVANSGSGNISVLLGTGSGTFQQSVSYGAGNGPSSIAAGDFNNDGFADLAVTNASGNNISILLGRGDGTFLQATNVSTGAMAPASALVGDFNGDGKADIAFSALSGGVNGGVLLGNGDGTFRAATTFGSTASQSWLVAGDFNSDGKADLVDTFSGNSTLTGFLGNGDGSLRLTGSIPVRSGAGSTNPSFIVVSDFDGDGRADLAISSSLNTGLDSSGVGLYGTNILLGNGDGTFQSALTYGSGDTSVALAAADFNGDGVADLVVANLNGNNVSVLLGIPAPSPQVISFPPLTNVAFGVTPISLAATASSQLPVLFTSSTTTVCTINGSVLTVASAGTCLVTANQSGNATYAAAFPVTQSFIVAQGAQSITFAALANVSFGSAPISLSGSTSSGLAVAFAGSTPTVCTVAGSSITLVGAGVCSLTASQPGNANYSAAMSVTRSFTVNPGTQTITFAPLSDIPFSTAAIPIAATSSSGFAVTFASTTTDVCTVAGASITLAKTGACSISASQAGSATYAAALPVVRGFTVSAGPQTITFATLSDTVFSPEAISIAATASSGLPVSFTSSAPTICTVTGSTIALVGAGVCPITASQPGNSNYLAATLVNRSFAVNPGPQTITFAPLSDIAFPAAAIPITASTSSSLPVTFSSAYWGLYSRRIVDYARRGRHLLDCGNAIRQYELRSRDARDP